MSVGEVFSGLLQSNWVSPGPTIDALIASMLARREKETSRGTRVVTGPLGAGKSTGGMGATMVNSAKQPAWPDLIRRYRLLVLRDTYANAWSQFVPFFEDWWARDKPGVVYEGSKGGPLDITLRMSWPEPIGNVDYMLQLRALGDHRTDNDIENFFRGLPTTDIWLEEGDTLPEAVYRKAITRLGRFPPRKVDGIGARTPTLYIVSNQFMIGTWPYNLKMQGKWRPGVELFEQPSAISPEAENLHNLSEGYYEKIIEDSDERTVRRQVYNEHVLPNAGKPVYGEYRDLVHTKPVTLDKNIPLRIGFDGGNQTLNPAAAIGQRGMARQLRIKAEVTVDEHGCGVERFAELVNRELGKEQYQPFTRDRKSIICSCDPSAQWGADKKAGQANWIVAMERRTGLRIKPARTNDIAPRRAALRKPMTRTIDGHPGLLVDPEAGNLRMALGGLFHFPKIRAGMATRDSDTPAKNHPYSDVAEAAEYMAMDDQAFGEFEGKKQGGDRSRRNREPELAETD